MHEHAFSTGISRNLHEAVSYPAVQVNRLVFGAATSIDAPLKNGVATAVHLKVVDEPDRLQICIGQNGIAHMAVNDH